MKLTDVLVRRAAGRAGRDNATMRFAQVTAVGGTTVTVLLDGASVSAARNLSAYPSPAVGDRVVLLAQGSVLIAMGKTA